MSLFQSFVQSSGNDLIVVHNSRYMKSPYLSPPASSNLTLTSSVVGLRLLTLQGSEYKVNNLPNNIVISIPVNNADLTNVTNDETRDGYRLSCQFWNGVTSSWDGTGCNTTLSTNAAGAATPVLCSCNHLTDFAVFKLFVKGISPQAPPAGPYVNVAAIVVPIVVGAFFLLLFVILVTIIVIVIVMRRKTDDNVVDPSKATSSLGVTSLKATGDQSKALKRTTMAAFNNADFELEEI